MKAGPCMGLLVATFIVPLLLCSCDASGGTDDPSARGDSGTYTLTYYASSIFDKGSVPPPVTFKLGDMITVSGNVGSLTGERYRFTGWSTTSGGTKEYSEGDQIYGGNYDIYLYISWEYLYPVEYLARYADGGTVPVGKMWYAEHEQVTVLDNTGKLSREGYEFDGWQDQDFNPELSYEPGSVFTMPAEDVYLYPTWKGTSPGGIVVPSSHTYSDVTYAESAVVEAMVFATSKDITVKATYATEAAYIQTNSVNHTIKYYFNGYNKYSYTLNGSITLTMNVADGSSTRIGTVTLTNNGAGVTTVNQIEYHLVLSTSAPQAGMIKYSFTDGTKWAYYPFTSEFIRTW